MTAITPFHYSYVTGQWFNHYIGVSVGLTFINKTTCILSLMFWIIIGLLVYYYCALRKLLGYCGWYMAVIKVLRPLPSRFVAKCLISFHASVAQMAYCEFQIRLGIIKFISHFYFLPVPQINNHFFESIIWIF